MLTSVPRLKTEPRINPDITENIANAFNILKHLNAEFVDIEYFGSRAQVDAYFLGVTKNDKKVRVPVAVLSVVPKPDLDKFECAVKDYLASTK